MSNNSAPDFGKAPTFDEVVKYAIDNDLFGKVSLVKFCDYYGDFRGKAGAVMDWKSKLHQWAARQRGQVIVSAKEYEAQARVQNKPEKKPANNIIAELQAKVAMI